MHKIMTPIPTQTNLLYTTAGTREGSGVRCLVNPLRGNERIVHPLQPFADFLGLIGNSLELAQMWEVADRAIELAAHFRDREAPGERHSSPVL